jgi:hypothetical protein
VVHLLLLLLGRNLFRSWIELMEDNEYKNWTTLDWIELDWMKEKKERENSGLVVFWLNLGGKRADDIWRTDGMECKAPTLLRTSLQPAYLETFFFFFFKYICLNSFGHLSFYF